MVGRQNECLSLCAKANALAEKIIFHVIPATLEAIAKYETMDKKNIFTVKSFAEFPDLPISSVAEKKRSDSDDMTAKEKVQLYLQATKKGKRDKKPLGLKNL